MLVNSHHIPLCLKITVSTALISLSNTFSSFHFKGKLWDLYILISLFWCVSGTRYILLSSSIIKGKERWKFQINLPNKLVPLIKIFNTETSPYFYYSCNPLQNKSYCLYDEKERDQQKTCYKDFLSYLLSRKQYLSSHHKRNNLHSILNVSSLSYWLLY